jgi:hypothetical protein
VSMTHLFLAVGCELNGTLPLSFCLPNGQSRAQETRLDITQFGLLLGAWIAAFMLGKELQSGFAQWWDRRK